MVDAMRQLLTKFGARRQNVGSNSKFRVKLFTLILLRSFGHVFKSYN